ncbi:MAG: urea ABC transporter ATP-binding subunit UrtE [Betaproteobacteria bacterium]
MLSVEKLNVFYGQSHVIHDLSFSVASGESVALMGRNGMGKTTLLKTVIGLLKAGSGRIDFDGASVASLAPYERVSSGFGYVPQGRMIFPYLTVEENILAGMLDKKRGIPSEIYEFFPVLLEMKNRKGGNLSGGQQQQLAIARALVNDPKILILDEPTEGIQPSIIKELALKLVELKKKKNFSLIVSEQVLSFTKVVADRFLILEKGEVVYESLNEDLDDDRVHSLLTI